MEVVDLTEAESIVILSDIGEIPLSEGIALFYNIQSYNVQSALNHLKLLQ